MNGLMMYFLHTLKCRKLLFLVGFAALSELYPIWGLPRVACFMIPRSCSILVFIGSSWLFLICFVWFMLDQSYIFIVNTGFYIIIFSAILLLTLLFKSNFLQDSKVYYIQSVLMERNSENIMYRDLMDYLILPFVSSL